MPPILDFQKYNQDCWLPEYEMKHVETINSTAKKQFWAEILTIFNGYTLTNQADIRNQYIEALKIAWSIEFVRSKF